MCFSLWALESWNLELIGTLGGGQKRKAWSSGSFSWLHCFDRPGWWSSEERGDEGSLMDPKALDGIIQRLLGVKGSKPGKQVQLLEVEIRQLCLVSKDIFLQQPNLLELEAPIKICGKL